MPLVTDPPAAARDTNSPAALDHSPSGIRVMVVEDGRNAAEILAMFFQMEGHEVCVAHDGLEAVQRSAVFQPRLILMDIGMPKMSGLEAARRIRRQREGEDLENEALIGLDQEDDKRQCAEAGMDYHLSKPVCPGELRSVIERFRERWR